MLRETPAERGCFGGCLLSTFIGGGSGALLGWLGGRWYTARLGGPSDESALLLQFMAAVVCFLVGSLVGGGIGLLAARKKAKEELEEEVL